ncbi:uncharacterized protein LOC131614131 [Vicia villosa]|uniref:uncharacterized protein LOC131614131 n=1 Tax=Vicia villosa TaxID=3911 RepID=UPI00273B443E|nr:uncharacterized protein LOC131614131 [Vicia villosa]
MDDNNNIPNTGPCLLQQLIEESTHEGTTRRRREGQQHTPAGKRRPRHETSQPRGQQIQNIQQLQGLQQVQNVEQVPPEGHIQNGEDEQARPQNGPEQPQNENETDARDGHVASLFTHTSDKRRVRNEDEEEQINIPEDADPTTLLLLKELQRTNHLIRQQGDRIHELERKRRYRSPPRIRHRSRSYSSSRSPPRRYRKRSSSLSRLHPGGTVARGLIPALHHERAGKTRDLKPLKRGASHPSRTTEAPSSLC